MADHLSRLSKADGLKPALRKDDIEGIRKIRRTINERTIQIKK
jgi:hypothetical protein